MRIVEHRAARSGAPAMSAISAPPAPADASVLDDPLEQQRFTRWSTNGDGQRVADSTLRLSGMYCAACAGIIEQALAGVDGVSQATPLDTFKTSLHAGHSVQQVLQLPVYGGVLAGLGWQWVNIAWLAGGLFLLWQKAIRWHI